MRDKYSPERIATLHPAIREKVRLAVEKAEAGFPEWMAIRIVEYFRSFEYQHALFCQPWDKKDNDGDGKIDEADEKVTNADAGKGFHNYGLAIDCAILYDKNRDGKYDTLSWDMVADFDRDGKKDWMEMVAAFESLGFEWGGRWKSIVDNPHFQMTFGYTWQQLLAKYQKGEFIPGTKFVKL